MGQLCTSGAAKATNNAPSTDESAPLNFKYQKGTCALEYWNPVEEIGEGSISSIHLVQRRDHHVDIPYKEKADIMTQAREAQRRSGTDSRGINKDKELYALKSIMKDHIRNDVFLQEMRNEIYTMSRLNHPNIIQVYEAYERHRHIYLIMEYCSGGDLLDVQCTEREAASIVRKILSAVAYMHKHNVVHRDCKFVTL